MTLAEVQDYVFQRLQSAESLRGALILKHDGTAGFVETSKDRNRALNDPSMGVCITVLPILANNLIQSAETGESPAAIISVALGVLIEENIKVSRAQGVGLPAETCLERVFASVIGPVTDDTPFGSSIGLDNPPFDNLGNHLGVQAYLAQFSYPLIVTSST